MLSEVQLWFCSRRLDIMTSEANISWSFHAQRSLVNKAELLPGEPFAEVADQQQHGQGFKWADGEESALKGATGANVSGVQMWAAALRGAAVLVLTPWNVRDKRTGESWLPRPPPAVICCWCSATFSCDQQRSRTLSWQQQRDSSSSNQYSTLLLQFDSSQFNCEEVTPRENWV